MQQVDTLYKRIRYLRKRQYELRRELDRERMQNVILNNSANIAWEAVQKANAGRREAVESANRWRLAVVWVSLALIINCVLFLLGIY